MEMPHSDLSEVSRMVLVHVRSVVVLSTSKTATTGMLAVLSYTTFTGGDVSAAAEKLAFSIPISQRQSSPGPIDLREISIERQTHDGTDSASRTRPGCAFSLRSILRGG